MKKVVCMLLVLTFFFGSVLPASASTTSTGSVNIFSHIYNGDLKWHLGERY